MSTVFVSVGMSLDGYIAGPNARPGNPLGDGGPPIHTWMYETATFRERLGFGAGGETGPDDDIVRHTFDRIGANVMGRRMFDEGEVGWPEEAPFGTPVFVVTNHAREPWVRKGGTTFFFVTDGIESALAQAKEAAGDKDVRISGGADVVRQYLSAGLVDELDIELAPVLLGSGNRLFDGLAGAGDIRLRTEGRVAHLRYRVAK
ncbi:dihydrofolate reductase family protein [Planotetraspora kaengkrachanensis]|uniref:Deaminase n=1 Tax=Planotetraspora kaengkrachanensis TaxID=575193 RepID=A0A8J3PX03_9ACTN|nr:dihydrofolate reductase family protein [Planotetraspora kaengkrachanensis]GIG82667.1 deaminase [Planotetraspora kaengkrachanensis]